MGGSQLRFRGFRLAVVSRGVTVLLVEQNVRQTLEMCDRAYVMETGRITLQGTGQELLGNEHVRRAYLGL